MCLFSGKLTGTLLARNDSEDEVDETTPIAPPTTRTSTLLLNAVQFLILVDHVFIILCTIEVNNVD